MAGIYLVKCSAHLFTHLFHKLLDIQKSERKLVNNCFMNINTSGLYVHDVCRTSHFPKEIKDEKPINELTC
jgi:hypothetical protein